VWDALGVHCSANERRADEASRDVENWLKCYFMQDKLGEEYTGIITGVTTFGIFVQLDQLFVEGLVHVTDLGQDYFQYDDARHELKGERTGKTFQLTDRVSVQVVRVIWSRARSTCAWPAPMRRASRADAPSKASKTNIAWPGDPGRQARQAGPQASRCRAPKRPAAPAESGRAQDQGCTRSQTSGSKKAAPKSKKKR
jgi:ribonuclease R